MSRMAVTMLARLARVRASGAGILTDMRSALQSLRFRKYARCRCSDKRNGDTTGCGTLLD